MSASSVSHAHDAYKSIFSGGTWYLSHTSDPHDSLDGSRVADVRTAALHDNFVPFVEKLFVTTSARIHSSLQVSWIFKMSGKSPLNEGITPIQHHHENTKHFSHPTVSMSAI